VTTTEPRARAAWEKGRRLHAAMPDAAAIDSERRDL
jgi:hypothetical protein